MPKDEMAFENQEERVELNNLGGYGMVQVTASSAEVIQRRYHSLLPGNANIGGTPAIVPCQFHDKNEIAAAGG